MNHDPETEVTIRYINYRGETAIRKIVPLGMKFSATEWHPDRQYLLDAWDVDKQALRSFAVKDISSWT